MYYEIPNVLQKCVVMLGLEERLRTPVRSVSSCKFKPDYEDQFLRTI